MIFRSFIKKIEYIDNKYLNAKKENDDLNQLIDNMNKNEDRAKNILNKENVNMINSLFNDLEKLKENIN